MKSKAVTGLVLTLFLIGTLTLAFNIQPVKASGTIYIRADGSVEPSTANITSADNVTYTFTDNNYDEIVVERDNIVVDGAGYIVQGTGSGKGIDLSDRNNVTIKNMKIKAFLCGIALSGSSNNSISGNNITANNNHGIWLGGSSSYNSIFGNNITNNPNGMVLVESLSNIISGNNITNNAYGLYLSASSKNTVTANSIAKNKRGVCLYDSPNNVFRGNCINSNDYNFGVSATHFPTSAFINDVDESNTVNSKPVYYWVNRQNNEVPADAGYVALVNSKNITVEELNLTHNVQGVLIAYSTSITIQNNVITENSDGVHLASSSNNRIVRNSITANSLSGVYLWPLSSDNIITRNNITNNWRGISLSGSSKNSIFGNNITNNEYGIRLDQSSNNKIYHNDFINNTSYQASAKTWCYNNIWDAGYPSGGNYWSNYNGTDSDQDGIGNTTYIIDENNTDNYPLMGIFSDFNATSEFNVQTICNSTISNFQFNGTAISFNVTGLEGTTGFCRICIPTALMDDTYRVFVNGTEVSYTLLPCSNSTHSYLYFTYNHSTQEVIIIPEFPAWTSVLLIITVLTVATAINKRRLKTPIH